MSDVEMQVDDGPETYQGGYAATGDESMGGDITSGAEDTEHELEPELEEEDPEALVEIDPKAILEQRMRQTDPVDYTSPEALAKAGLTKAELEKKDEDDPEFVGEDVHEESEADVSMV